MTKCWRITRDIYIYIKYSTETSNGAFILWQINYRSDPYNSLFSKHAEINLYKIIACTNYFYLLL